MSTYRYSFQIPMLRDTTKVLSFNRDAFQEATAIPCMEDILAMQKSQPLTAKQEKGIQKTLEEAREYYKRKGLM